MKKIILFAAFCSFLVSCKKNTPSNLQTERELASEPGFEKLASCSLADSSLFSILAKDNTIRLVKDGAAGAADTFVLKTVSESRQPITTNTPEGRLFSNTTFFSSDQIELVVVYADKYTNNGSLRLTFKDESKTVVECSQNFNVDLAILAKSVQALK